MKRISLIISFVMLFALGGIAQKGDFRIGLKLGPSFDWASSGSEQTKNDGMKVGFTTGLVFDRYFTDHIAISSGVNLNLLRMKYNFTDVRKVDGFLQEVSVMVNRQLKATNVEVPIKLKVNVDVADSFRAYVEAGAGLSYNIKDLGKDNYTFNWISYESQGFGDCTHQYRPLQVSMVFGLGAEYEINRNFSAFAQLTFDHAFSNAFNKALKNQTGSILRNNFIGFEVGILY